jgi:2-methylcitrate dehydratase PrpD
VTVKTRDGYEYAEFVEHAQGDHRNPFTDKRLREKYHALTDPVLGREQASELHDAVTELPDVTPATLTALATPDE